MRRLVFALLATLLLLTVAVPSVAAESNKPLVIDITDADESAFWTAECGFPVVAEAAGHIIIHRDKTGAITGKAVYNLRETLTTEHGTFRFVDAGPDLFFERHGETYIAVVGRSITGSGVIGRVVVDATTFEIISISGRVVGDVGGVGETLGDQVDVICEALGPA